MASTWPRSGSGRCPEDQRAAGVPLRAHLGDQDRPLRASAGDLLARHAPEQALRAWMNRFAGYVAVKREMADTLRAVFAAGPVTVSQARAQLTEAVRTILDAGLRAGTLRDDVRPEDIVATIVGMCTATSLDGGHEQLERMFDLLMKAVRRSPGGASTPITGEAGSLPTGLLT